MYQVASSSSSSPSKATTTVIHRQDTANNNDDADDTTNNNNGQVVKMCENVLCRTTNTPLWRKGWTVTVPPLTDKSSSTSSEQAQAQQQRKVRLCNACGLHYRKGHFCYFCNQVYRDTSEPEMLLDGWIMCKACERWVHRSCALKHIPHKVPSNGNSSGVDFTCSNCVDSVDHMTMHTTNNTRHLSYVGTIPTTTNRSHGQGSGVSVMMNPAEGVPMVMMHHHQHHQSPQNQQQHSSQQQSNSLKFHHYSYQGNNANHYGHHHHTNNSGYNGHGSHNHDNNHCTANGQEFHSHHQHLHHQQESKQQQSTNGWSHYHGNNNNNSSSSSNEPMIDGRTSSSSSNSSSSSGHVHSPPIRDSKMKDHRHPPPSQQHGTLAHQGYHHGQQRQEEVYRSRSRGDSFHSTRHEDVSAMHHRSPIHFNNYYGESQSHRQHNGSSPYARVSSPPSSSSSSSGTAVYSSHSHPHHPVHNQDLGYHNHNHNHSHHHHQQHNRPPSTECKKLSTLEPAFMQTSGTTFGFPVPRQEGTVSHGHSYSPRWSDVRLPPISELFTQPVTRHSI